MPVRWLTLRVVAAVERRWELGRLGRAGRLAGEKEQLSDGDERGSRRYDLDRQ